MGSASGARYRAGRYRRGGVAVRTRVTFGPELLQAIQVRGLTLSEVARLAGLSLATVSAAVRGHSVNMRTAMLVSRAVASRPVIPELEAWLSSARTGG